MADKTLVTCCIPLCGNTSETPNVHLFSFTRDSKLKKDWIHSINEDMKKNIINPTPFTVKKSSKICSAHFAYEDLIFKTKKRLLKPNAIPTIFEWTENPESSSLSTKLLTEPDIILEEIIETSGSQLEKQQTIAGALVATDKNQTSKDAGPSKHQQGKALNSGQKLMVYNVFLSYMPVYTKSERVNFASHQTGVGASTIWKIIKEMETNGKVVSPKLLKPRKKTSESIDETTKQLIRKTVQNVLYENEIPTLNKIKEAIDENEKLPKFSRSTLWRVLQSMGFSFSKKSGNFFDAGEKQKRAK